MTFQNIKQNIAKRKLALTAGTVALVASASSHAALDAAVTAAFTSLETLVGDYTAPAFSLMAAVLVFFIGLKWFKSVANKAS